MIAYMAVVGFVLPLHAIMPAIITGRAIATIIAAVTTAIIAQALRVTIFVVMVM